MIMPLDQVCTGVWCRVVEINTEIGFRKRLGDFGLLPGTHVRRRFETPRGDVMAIELRGSVIALRRGDLHRIQVYV